MKNPESIRPGRVSLLVKGAIQGLEAAGPDATAGELMSASLSLVSTLLDEVAEHHPVLLRPATMALETTLLKAYQLSRPEDS